MFPISDTIKLKGFPLVTILIIAFTFYVFYQEVTLSNPDAFIRTFSLIPDRVRFTSLLDFVPFITAIFLHGGWLHIITNMWFLWVFGNDVELSLGKLKFLLIYFSAGLLGNIVQYALMPNSPIPMLGASGAIAGILGSYYLLFPGAKVRTLVFILFFITIITIPAPIMLGYWFFLQVFSGLFSLPGTGDAGGIAFFAHVTGFLVGALLGGILAPRR